MIGESSRGGMRSNPPETAVPRVQAGRVSRDRSADMRDRRPADRPVLLRTAGDKKTSDRRDVVSLLTESVLETKKEHAGIDAVYDSLVKDFLTAFGEDMRKERGMHRASIKFQNRLLRVLYQDLPGFSVRELQNRILSSANMSRDPIVQREAGQVGIELEYYKNGVGEVLGYIQSREDAFEKEHKGAKVLSIGTNDELDAEHKIDLVEAIADSADGIVEEVRFVQIKSGRFDESERNTVHRAHEEYVGLLRSSKTQERMERIVKGAENLKIFTEQVSSTKSADRRFDLYGERYNDLLLECLLVCQKDARQFGVDDEKVDEWLKKIHPNATDEERMTRMTEFGLMLRSSKSQELFRVFAMATGEEHIEEVV